jgi:hypothetical protein
MADNQKPFTHTAFALKREGKRQQFRRWLDIGVGRQNPDGSFTGYLDRTPIGGWTGYVHFAPKEQGTPPLPAERPAQEPDSDEATGEED